MKYSILAFLLTVSVSASAQTTIRGVILDGTGKPARFADAHFSKYGADQKHVADYHADAQGNFAIDHVQAGIYSLKLSAVDHQESKYPLILNDRDTSITITAQLAFNPYQRHIESVKIIGDWVNYQFGRGEEMTPSTINGHTVYTYNRLASGDTLGYQLLGIAGGHSVNGTQADYSVYDGGGDYRSVLRVRKGEKATITFDPAKLPSVDESNIRIVSIQGDAFLAKAVAIWSDVRSMDADLRDAAGEIDKSKMQALFDLLWTNLENARNVGDADLAQFAAILLASQYHGSELFKREWANAIMQLVPASSNLWALVASNVAQIVELANSPAGPEYIKLLESNPERTVRALAYADEMERAVRAKNETDWRRLYATLKADYGDVPEIKWTLIQNNPNAAVQVGRLVPKFELPLEGSKDKISNSSMHGRYYMIDFWATWCHPCVGEMPAIHKAYEKFKGRRGFEILSLDMDNDFQSVGKFRANKFKMPWLHAFLPGMFESPIATDFEVVGIPKPILVDPDGKIVAMEGDLRGGKLEKTLAKYLGVND